MENIYNLLKELKKRIIFTIILFVVVFVVLFACFITELRVSELINFRNLVLFVFFNIYIYIALIAIFIVFVLWLLFKKYHKTLSYLLILFIVPLINCYLYLQVSEIYMSLNRNACINKASVIINYLEQYNKEHGCYPQKEKFNPNMLYKPKFPGISNYIYRNSDINGFELIFDQQIENISFYCFRNIYTPIPKNSYEDIIGELKSANNGWKYYIYKYGFIHTNENLNL